MRVDVLSGGDGEDVVDPGEFVLANYLGQTWAPDAEGDVNVVENSFTTGAPVGFPVGVGAVLPGWDEGLAGQRVGSRVLVSIPPALGYGERSTGSIPGNSTLLYVFDLVAAFGEDQGVSGEPVEALPDGLPAVSGEGAAEPVVEFGSTAWPVEESGATLLVRGDGAEFGDNLVVKVLTASYSTGEVLYSSWRETPVAIPVDGTGALPGLADALAGARVGSRVLVRVSVDDNTEEPMDMMGMAEPLAPTPGDPLAIVVDVIGTY
nr:FKBP-type peptidyl-prolyl cis-trans isomerase [Jiangella mangrovi]